jgi:nicotinamide riboside kinase
VLNNYWPNSDQVKNCIRTEAEELDSFVLQVVHEPMSLTSVNIKTNRQTVIESEAEEALLEHLKSNPRPIPILGDAGSGKSHLIRLLHVKLNDDPMTKDWIVKRIHKSSSLKEVLETLLDGMEGKEFDDIRGRIKEVVEKNKPEQVADHLITFMGHRLQDLLEDAESRKSDIKNTGRTISEEERENLSKLMRHASRGKLPSLLSDPNFKERLIEPGKCIYNIGKRLISGSTESEIINNDYALKISDLDLSSLQIGDLSSNTQAYIREQQLTTNDKKVVEVVELLNQILGDSCRIAFQQLFGFGGGAFQDLFKEIRQILEQQGKTLVVLVEDMAAITAIENDLIDSLLLESTRDGEKTLCDVHSALAVTSGYIGYNRRRETIATRSGGVEWHINRFSGSVDEMYERIQNFCGRYLNASRYNLDDIRTRVTQNILPLDPWDDPEIEESERDCLKDFGFSSQGYSLFPYNKAALKVLTDQNCINTKGELEFNPRTVLSHVLIPILRDYRSAFVAGHFPPANFLNLTPPTTLQSEIRVSDETKRQQSLSAASFWGYEASSKSELVRIMPSSVASVMGMEDLAELLSNTTPAAEKIPIPVSPSPIQKPTPVVEVPVSPVEETDIASLVDIAFKSKNINQEMANDIRSELFNILSSELSHVKKWVGVNIDIPKIIKKDKKAPLIYVPFNTNNPNKHYASFGDLETLSDSIKNLEYRQFLIAVLKRKALNKDHASWDSTLYNDYCRYKNFVSKWLEKTIPSIVSQVQEEFLADALKPVVESACIIHPSFMSSNNDNKVDILCSNKSDWEDDLRSDTGEVEWDNYKNELIKNWDDEKRSWINYVAYNDYAISRDIVQAVFKNFSPPVDSRLAQSTRNRILDKYRHIIDAIDGCDSKEEFSEGLNKMNSLVTKMKQNDQFELSSIDLTSTKFINRIKKITNKDEIPRHWTATAKLLKLAKPYTIENFVKSISNFKAEDLEPVSTVVEIWNHVYDLNLPIYREVNRTNNSESRVEKENLIIERISKARNRLVFISEGQESANENS